ncbi:MAG: hypothetical protein RQ877_03765 [Vulcanisaeta sp.]|nr:hypothetical protein [Vulcanisaeta sp.]
MTVLTHRVRVYAKYGISTYNANPEELERLATTKTSQQKPLRT